MTNWAYKEGSLGYKVWHRSYRQVIETAFRKPVVLMAYIEELRIYDDGRIETNRNLPVISIPLAELVGEDLDKAMLIHGNLTTLIGDRVNALLNPPPPDPDPPVDPPVDPDPTTAP